MATSSGTKGPNLAKLDKVSTLFQEQLDQGLHPGAALAVYLRGELILDLHGGIANKETNEPVNSDTLFTIFSCTKAITAFCWHILRSRGQIELGHWIADYWPEFGNNGKQRITSRHILTHTAGFPDTPQELKSNKLVDWDAAITAMETASPTYEPGEVIAYHSLNFGWVIGETIRRVDGRSVNQFLRDEVTGPLNLDDIFIGLPPNQEARVATTYGPENDELADLIELLNTSEGHQAIIPAANGIATARDLAGFYAMLSMGGKFNGTEIVRPGIIKEIAAIQEKGIDVHSGRHVNLGLGLAIDDPAMGLAKGSTRYRHRFGHGGLRSCIAWANIENQVAVAIVTNGIRDEASNTQRLAQLSDSIWDACS